MSLAHSFVHGLGHHDLPGCGARLEASGRVDNVTHCGEVLHDHARRHPFGLPQHLRRDQRQSAASSRSRLVEVQKQPVRDAHDFGVLPLGGPVVAGDQAHAVQPTEVAEHEGIARLGLL